MKCPHCGGEMSLEDKLCPYCGMPNEEAAEHAREMRRYRESYRKTEAEVKEKTKRQTARFTKIILSLVLILLSVAAVWFGRNAYSFRYNQKRADAVRHADAYREKLDSFLKEGDYAAFLSFAEREKISFYEEPYEEYIRIADVGRHYLYFLDDTRKLLVREKYTDLGSMTEYIADALDDLAKDLADPYDYYQGVDSEKSRLAVEDMTGEIRAVLIRYFGFTEEEAEDVFTMSGANRRLLLERGMAAYEQE